MNKEALSENYVQRANVRASLGKYEKAITDYDTAIRLKPQHAEAYYNRGLAKANLGQYEAAIADFDAALDLNPQDAMAYTNRGEAKGHLEKHEEARTDLQRALELATEQGNEKVREAAQELLNKLLPGNSHENKR